MFDDCPTASTTLIYFVRSKLRNTELPNDYVVRKGRIYEMPNLQNVEHAHEMTNTARKKHIEYFSLILADQRNSSAYHSGLYFCVWR